MLDQGERVDWLNSDWLPTLAITAFGAMAAFTIRRTLSRQAGFDIRVLAQRNLLTILFIIAASRSLISANGFLIQQYLVAVQGHRPIQFGAVFLWLVIPQIVVAPVVALLLPGRNARICHGAGIGAGSSPVSGSARASRPLGRKTTSSVSQLLQGIGQSVLLTSTLWFAVAHLRPDNALSFGAFLQIARLLGGEMGTVPPAGVVAPCKRRRFDVPCNASVRRGSGHDGTAAKTRPGPRFATRCERQEQRRRRPGPQRPCPGRDARLGRSLSHLLRRRSL